MSEIVNPEIIDPYIDNRVVKSMQSQLAAIGWLEYIYPMAERGERPNKSGRTIYPRVLKQERNDYIDLFPNDKMDSFCFFERRQITIIDSLFQEVPYDELMVA